MSNLFKYMNINQTAVAEILNNPIFQNKNLNNEQNNQNNQSNFKLTGIREKINNINQKYGFTGFIVTGSIIVSLIELGFLYLLIKL